MPSAGNDFAVDLSQLQPAATVTTQAQRSAGCPPCPPPCRGRRGRNRPSEGGNQPQGQPMQRQTTPQLPDLVPGDSGHLVQPPLRMLPGVPLEPDDYSVSTEVGDA